LLSREPARPIVRRTAGFHYDAQRRAIVEHACELGSVDPPALDDACIGIGEGKLEHVLGEVDGDGGNGAIVRRSMHGGLRSRSRVRIIMICLAHRSRVATRALSV
jgi:hypothetical protein